MSIELGVAGGASFSTAETLFDKLVTAAPLTELDSSLLETMLGYIESDQPGRAAEYVLAASDEGLCRMVRNLNSLAPVLVDEFLRRRREALAALAVLTDRADRAGVSNAGR